MSCRDLLFAFFVAIVEADIFESDLIRGMP